MEDRALIRPTGLIALAVAAGLILAVPRWIHPGLDPVTIYDASRWWPVIVLATGGVAAHSGQILAGSWAGHSGGAVEVAAANAEMVRQVRLALGALQLDATEELHDIVVSMRRQLHLLQVLPRQQWLLYLAIPTQNTNLALARTVLRAQAD